MFNTNFDATTGKGFGTDNEPYLNLGTKKWVEYPVDITQSQEYTVDFRLTTSPGNHTVALYLDGKKIKTQIINSTTSYNTWETKSFTIDLDEGSHILKLKVTTGWLNLNWMRFKSLVGLKEKLIVKELFFSPNPAKNMVYFSDVINGTIKIYDLSGKTILKSSVIETDNINIESLQQGVYIIQYNDTSGQPFINRLIKE